MTPKESAQAQARRIGQQERIRLRRKKESESPFRWHSNHRERPPLAASNQPATQTRAACIGTHKSCWFRANDSTGPAICRMEIQHSRNLNECGGHAIQCDGSIVGRDEMATDASVTPRMIPVARIMFTITTIDGVHTNHERLAVGRTLTRKSALMQMR